MHDVYFIAEHLPRIYCQWEQITEHLFTFSFIHSRKFLRWVLTSGSSWRVDPPGRTWRDRSASICGSRPGRTAASPRRTTGQTSSSTRTWWASSLNTRSGSSGWDTGSVEVSFLFILLLTPLKQGLILSGRLGHMNHFRFPVFTENLTQKNTNILKKTRINIWIKGLNYPHRRRKVINS